MVAFPLKCRGQAMGLGFLGVAALAWAVLAARPSNDAETITVEVDQSHVIKARKKAALAENQKKMSENGQDTAATAKAREEAAADKAAAAAKEAADNEAAADKAATAAKEAADNKAAADEAVAAAKETVDNKAVVQKLEAEPAAFVQKLEAAEDARKAATEAAEKKAAVEAPRPPIATPGTFAALSYDQAANPNTRASFVALRKLLRDHGVPKLKDELEEKGIAKDGWLTTGVKPFNPFARIGAAEMSKPNQPNCAPAEKALLRKAKSKFVVCCNRPENDELEHVKSNDEEWKGKASMSERHRFLTVRDLDWRWFNAISFGIGGGDDLSRAITRMEDVLATAKAFAKANSWSSNVGFFFHVYPHNSVHSFHLHIVDLDFIGPTYEVMKYKNLPAEEVLAVLRAEEKQEKDRGITVQTLNDRNNVIRPHSQACPTDYTWSSGDIVGEDRIGRGLDNQKSTLESCGTDCDSRSDCLSFEYSPSKAQCYLNKVQLPSLGPNEDFAFCSKALEGKKEEDHAGEEMKHDPGASAMVLLEAVRRLHVAEPNLGYQPLLVKLWDQQPGLKGTTEEVRAALAALKAESKAAKA